MGIPVGKLSLYTALGGVRPSACLPITIDVGTNNEQLLQDEFYIGLRQKRATGQEYADFLHEFMSAVKQNYGEKVLVQFEDFANHNAFELLAKYRPTHLVFNDDIQGTAAVVLSGVVAALKLLGGTLADQTFLFLGAGEAGTGIAELIALEMSKQAKAPVEEARKKIWPVDSKGLIVGSRKESLQQFKKPWAHEHEPVKDLLGAVKAIKPTILIGSSGVGKTFTKEVIEALCSFNKASIALIVYYTTSFGDYPSSVYQVVLKGMQTFSLMSIVLGKYAFNRIQRLLSKTHGKVVGDLMTPAPLVVRETTNLEDAASDNAIEMHTVSALKVFCLIKLGPSLVLVYNDRLLLETKYHRLPVVDGNGQLIGIITRGNVVRAALQIKRANEHSS
ncbi:hypothetical protein EUGRSUZ_L01765 [Eucalyptus grandis]|uniref:Malic enzyme n=1 Tax=Eucalyptus grandis TaxID=71139 RepID=A0A058ZSB0_EUCGR|nr:hypothetical protein EUGRSUZ_L01765 [Eucalyptus grandis]